MTLSEVRRILEDGPARRREAGKDVWFLDTGPWWRFFSNFRGLERTKAQLLHAAWQLPSNLFVVLPEPLAPELAPLVRPHGSAWRVNKARPAQEFYNTEPASGLGNWQLYAADAPVTSRLPDTFRTSPEIVLGFMAEHDLVLLIDTFHDDTDWCVAVRGPESSTAAA